MTKATNYLLTATEVKTMVNQKLAVADTQQSVIKTGNIGVTNNFYVNENQANLSSYTVNRLPRYQDVECPPSGLNMTVDTISVNDNDIHPPHNNPIYGHNFSYYFDISAIAVGPNGDAVFTCTVPNNITLVAFRYVRYNYTSICGTPGCLPLPTSDWYDVTDFNVATGYVRIVLKKDIYGAYQSYQIAFNAYPNQPYGTFTTTGCVSALYNCPTPYVACATNSFSLTAPNLIVTKTVLGSSQFNCGTVTDYKIDVTNTGGSIIGTTLTPVILTDTLPSGVSLGVFSAITYDDTYICGNPGCLPLPTSDYYNITLYQQGQNAGSFTVYFWKEIGNGLNYTMYFSAYSTGANPTASFQNTATITFTPPASLPNITASGSVTSSYTTYPSSRYYQLNGCNTSFAYTLIVPLGLNNRYILPSSPDIFTYGGAYVDQCTVPPGLNTFIQQTASYNCTDPTTTTTTTAIVPVGFNMGYTCIGNNDATVTINSFSGGSGQYEFSALATSAYNAISSGFTYSNFGYQEWYNVQNGQWYAALRDANNHSNITVHNTSNFQCCPNTTPDWQNNGSYNCYSTCNQYYVQTDINNCSLSYGQTQQGALYSTNSTYCGGCCGQGPCCGQSTSQTQGGQVGDYYYCSNGNTFSNPVYVNDNPCYLGGNIYLLNGNWTSNNPSNSAPNVSPIWNNVGDPYCSGCNEYQNQVDVNTCSSSYGNPRVPPVNLGLNSTCGTWNLEYYCVGYEKWSRLRNTCTNATCCDALVEVDSPYCGYVPPPTCRTYQIIGYNSDEYVDGTYTNCAGYPDSFSFYGGPGTVGSVCAQPSSVYITSGNGAANDVGGC